MLHLTRMKFRRLGRPTLLFLGTSVSALLAQAYAQDTNTPASFLDKLDPNMLLVGGAVALTIGACAWALRVSRLARGGTMRWSQKLAELEAKFEQSESILASHPGLVLVWDDAYADIEQGWGTPRVLGGPAALASLLAFSAKDPADFANPADGLLNALGRLPLEDDEAADRRPTLAEKVENLRTHGVAFSGSVITDEGRSIECDGRVAGDQVTLWLTDPAVRLADEAGVVGQARDKAADLHGALNQLDRAPLAAWRRGPDLKLEWVNRAYVEMVEAINMQQVVDEQLELDPAFKVLTVKAKKELERSGRRALDGIVKVNIKGQRKALRVIEMPLHNAGDPSFGGMAIDVTRQERAQDDLDRQHQAHRKTLDQLSAAVAVFNAAQQLEYYNQAFVELWGLDDAELRTRPSHGEILDRLRHLEKLPAKDDFAAWKERELRLYTEEYGEDSSATDGAVPDEIWDLPSGKTMCVRQQRHSLGGVAVVFEDITETLKLQSQYQTQIGVQHETLNNLAEAVAVFSSDGRLALFNRAFEATWRFSREDLASLPHFSILAEAFRAVAPDAEDAIEEIRRRIISFAPEDRVPIAGEELSLADGRILMSASSPLPDGATLLTFTDVTDSRERQKELELRNQVLEEADRIKSRFVNHISYQLRNPLTTIIGFTEVLETEMFGELNERQHEYASSVLQASNQLLDLVDDIIDLAAIDAGRLGLDMQRVDVRELLESAGSLAAVKAEDSQVRLEIACAEDIGSILIDEKRIRQALFNLLANAFTFTEAGGQVTLGARRDGDAVDIWVADNGRGVSPQDQATVFDRFESSGPGAGAGLGLALVSSFVELHGGIVRLKSEDGQGTTVTCHLPVDGPSQLPLASEDDDAVAMLMDGDETLPHAGAAE